MIELKILVVIISGVLFAWGGYNWHNARRFILPCLLSAMALLLSHSLWSLTMLSCMGAFCLGYGDKSPLRHALGNAWGRSFWGLLAATCLSLPLFLTHHLAVVFFVAYLALSFTLENALKNIGQLIGDCIIGAAFGSIVFLIHV